MNFSKIPAGVFMMGANHDEDRLVAESPRREEIIARDFQISRTPVTKGQWAAVMGEQEKKSNWEADLPVVVAWREAVLFCEKLTARERPALNGGRYRLPTEAEWEYACRAGSDAPWSFGADEAELSEHAWYQANANNRPHKVGLKRPNAWGLYDMHGNVWEWTRNLPSSNTGREKPTTKPSHFRMLRGGAFNSTATACRSAARLCDDWAAMAKKHAAGFRIVIVQEDEAAEAGVDEQDGRGRTALRTLRELGANLFAKDNSGLTALDWARRNGDADTAEILQQLDETR